MCILCERVALMKEKRFAPLVKEFESSFLVIGEHQYFTGYSVLIHKECIEDITDIEESKQVLFHKELMEAARVVKKYFSADRINYSCLGNVVSHLHYHIFPRTRDELSQNEKKDPWANAENFSQYTPTEEEYRSLAKGLSLAFDNH